MPAGPVGYERMAQVSIVTSQAGVVISH
ncbi:hypothetical protein GA0115255_106471, partial [Streptomyces sp. Ncost-T6T-2b]